MISVVNIKDYGVPKNSWEVYIGRKNVSYGLKESPLANPFKTMFITKVDAIIRDRDTVTARTREEAIRLYKEMFYKEIDSGNVFITRECDRLRELHRKHGELILVCWCAPRLCHGNIIKDHLEHEG